MTDEKVLVGYVDSDIREIIVMMLESEFDHSIIEVDSGQAIIDEFLNDHTLKLLIADINLKELGGEKVYLSNFEMNNLPFIFITKDNISNISELKNISEDNEYNASLGMPFDHEEFSEIVSKALLSQMNTDEAKEKAIPFSRNSKYYRMKLTRILKLKKSFGHIFIKLSEEKYIKVLNNGDMIEKEKFERYLQKGVDYLYLDKEQFNEYLDNRVNALMNRLDQTDLKKDEAVCLHLESIQQVQEVAMSIGVKKQIIELADKLTGNIIDTIKKNKNLKDFLSPTDKKNGYQFEHSNLVNYLVCGISNHMSSQITEKATQKLIQASIFCDVGLSEDNLSQIISKDDEKYNELDKGNKKIIDKHIKDGADAILKTNHPEIDEIEKIILAHHEKPDGSGFPRGLDNSNLSQLSAAFIIAYDFAHKIIMCGEKNKIDPDQILLDMGAAYSEHNFKTPFIALKNALK